MSVVEFFGWPLRLTIAVNGREFDATGTIRLFRDTGGLRIDTDALLAVVNDAEVNTPGIVDKVRRLEAEVSSLRRQRDEFSDRVERNGDRIIELEMERDDLRRRLDGVRTFIVEEDPHGRTTEDDGGQW